MSSFVVSLEVQILIVPSEYLSDRPIAFKVVDLCVPLDVQADAVEI